MTGHLLAGLADAMNARGERERGADAAEQYSWRVELRKDDKPVVDVIAESLGLKKLRVVGTGGNAYMRQRTQ
jgi:hypothetical protein